MVHFKLSIGSFFAISALASSYVQAAPIRSALQKRIQQTIVDSTVQWVQACTAAGGGLQCNPISVTAFTTLLIAAGPCDQQNSADAMIDLAKTLNNDANMIKFAQLFAQQPRNSPNSQAVPYCQQAPRNAELNGAFQCQFQGDNEQTFVGGAAVGSPGTIPFGLTSPVSPAGSCPAHTSGPIADGTQLTDITSDPGAVGSTANSGSGSSSGAISVASTPVSSSGALSTGGFQLQNGQAAQALNAKFAGLSASSSCNDGDEACVNGSFAQCVGGTFVLTSCGATLQCAALPLVLSAGTSITCTTQADALTRIANTGATGGLTGN
ncbi:hypothetical protein EUX98_g3386 [Antrodiella citrinella]|uniref:Carbohydrate-binding module family 19 domain-containing protein n=1 Tax=Antrodiella citrinella TaxID=2447956 RepID=A0A4S4MZ57_9APHY|nr:hypothetical protein EUX98_g3386 [Antrodiella citrinella]